MTGNCFWFETDLMKASTIFFIALVGACMMPTTVGATEIILDQASPEIFPEAWRGGKIKATAQPLLDTEVERFRRIVDRALAKYPKSLLERSLVKLYGLGHLEYSGVVTGGTRSANAIYVVCKPQANYTDEAVERIIHAEYSSVLFQKFAKDFDAEAWKKQNAEGATYLGSGVAAVKAGKISARVTPELHEQGFISEYAQASIEEDFNSHVARLFIGDEAYWQTIEKHPRLKAKAELVMAFYEKLDASMNRTSFARLRELASQLSLSRIFTDKEFEEEKMEAFQWSKHGAYYFQLEKPAQGKEGKDLVKHDAATGKRSVLITAQEMTPKGEKKPLSVSEFQFSEEEKHVILFTNTKKVWRKNTRGDYWLLDLTTKKLSKLGGGAEPSTLMFAKFSPDGSRVAYVRNNKKMPGILLRLPAAGVTKWLRL